MPGITTVPSTFESQQQIMSQVQKGEKPKELEPPPTVREANKQLSQPMQQATKVTLTGSVGSNDATYGSALGMKSPLGK